MDKRSSVDFMLKSIQSEEEEKNTKGLMCQISDLELRLEDSTKLQRYKLRGLRQKHTKIQDHLQQRICDLEQLLETAKKETRRPRVQIRELEEQITELRDFYTKKVKGLQAKEKNLTKSAPQKKNVSKNKNNADKVRKSKVTKRVKKEEKVKEVKKKASRIQTVETVEMKSTACPNHP
eukprot:UN23262